MQSSRRPQEAGNREWDELRKQARHMESELDVKLIQVKKLSSASRANARLDVNNDIGQIRQEDLEQMNNLLRGVEEILNHLESVNDRMQRIVEETPVAQASHVHMMRRHRDILADYFREYRQLQENVRTLSERNELFANVQRDINSYRNSQDYYLGERQQLSSSHNVLDESISIAMSAKDALMGNRDSFEDISGRMKALVQRFPQINNLMQRISRRKARDKYIMVGVISFCIILMFLYVF
eukprot:Clim_evm75s225 gene=Clim_evmTU75s225